MRMMKSSSDIVHPCLTLRGKYALLTIPNDGRVFLKCSAQSSGYLVERTHITFVSSLFSFLDQLISEGSLISSCVLLNNLIHCIVLFLEARFLVVGILQFQPYGPQNKEVIGEEVSFPEDADI